MNEWTLIRLHTSECTKSKGSLDLCSLWTNVMQSIGENVMTPHQIWTNFLLTMYGVWFRTYVKHFATLFKFHWILSKSGRLILHWFTMNVFMVLCSTLMEHNLTTKCAHKKYTYVFNIEKYSRQPKNIFGNLHLFIACNNGTNRCSK